MPFRAKVVRGVTPPPQLSRNPPHPFTLYPGTFSRRSGTRPETKPNPEQIAAHARRRCRTHSRRQARRHDKPGRHTPQRKPGANTARETLHKARKASRRRTPGDTPTHTNKPGKSPYKPGDTPGLYGYLIPHPEAIQHPPGIQKASRKKPHFSGLCKNPLKPAWYKGLRHSKTP